MMDQKRNVWLIRSGKQGEYESRFIQEEVIGFPINVGNTFNKPSDLKELNRLIKTLYAKEERSGISSRIFTLTNRISIGDYIIMPSKNNSRMYHIGIITGDYVYNPQSDISFTRTVKWKGSIERTKFDQKTRNSMGSLLSLFHVNITKESMEMLSRYME